MNLIKPLFLEEIIVDNLKNGEKKNSVLLEQVRQRKKGITKQGFYAALRKLKKEEIVVVYKGISALNTSWISDMLSLFEVASNAYGADQGFFNVLSLKEKESASFVFNTAKALDIFWGHSQNILLRNTPQAEPCFAYDPHYWFYLARPITEKKLITEITSRGRQYLMTVSDNLPLDKIVAKDFNTDLLQYAYKKMSPKENYYFTVIGGYLTEVFIDYKLAEQIESIYQTRNHIDISLEKEFAELINTKGRFKIKITRSSVKVEQFKGKLRKLFYIQKHS